MALLKCTIILSFPLFTHVGFLVLFIDISLIYSVSHGIQNVYFVYCDLFSRAQYDKTILERTHLT